MKNLYSKTQIPQIFVHGLHRFHFAICYLLFAISLVICPFVKAEDIGAAAIEQVIVTASLTPTSTLPATQLPTITIHLQIETFDATLYHDDLEVTACLASPSSTEATLNGWCAVEQIANLKGWSISSSPYGDVKFLSSINNYNGADYNWWAFFHNDDLNKNLIIASEGLNKYSLKLGDHVLLSYGIYPSKTETDNQTPVINSTSTIKISGFDVSSWQWSPLLNSTVIINNEEKNSNDGTYELAISAITHYSIYSKKEGYINSDTLIITPQAPTTTLLRLQISTTTPYVNTTSTITLEESSFDADWKLVWNTAASSTIVIDSQEFTNENGVYQYFATDTLPHAIFGKKNNYLDSNIVIVTAQNMEIVTDPPPPQPPQGNPGPANILVSDDLIREAVDKILAYLKSQQDSDGKIIDGRITDWAIMSFASDGQYAEEIKKDGKSLLDYAKSYDITSASEMNVCASYPRHIMALLSAGIQKDDSAIQSMANKIKSNECYKDNMYGLNGINDDAFALLALLAIDTRLDEPIVSSTIKTIMDDQTADGASTWAGYPSADITGAAINALNYAKSKGCAVENTFFDKAKSYLKKQQDSDGRWGDPLTTSWAMMGINSIGETQKNWFNASGKNPWHTMISSLNNEGYYGASTTTIDWFATQHAVPAILGDFWPIILPPKEKIQPETNKESNGGGGNGGFYIDTATTTPTTTIFTASSTISLLDKIKLNIENLLTIPPAEAAPVEAIAENQPEEKNVAGNLPVITTPKKRALPRILPLIQTSEKVNLTAPTSSEPLKMIAGESISSDAEISQLTTSTAKMTKTIFGGSLALASGLGLYLGWRLLQSLV